jgi:hypothetical protein
MDVAALITAIASFVGAGVYLFLGGRLAARRVSAQARLPGAQFAVFWLGFAAVTLCGAFLSLIATFAVPSDALVVTVVHLEILLLCAMLWGLLGYLTYLYTGRNWLLAWSVFYGALYLFLSYLITVSKPTVVTVTQGSVGVQYAAPFGGLLLYLLLALLIAPEFIGAILYFTLIFRSRDPTVRFRVTLVSWSIILWFGLSAIDPAARLGGGLAAELLSHLLGVGAAVVILIAYYPPRAIRERLGVAGIEAPRRPSTAPASPERP